MNVHYLVLTDAIVEKYLVRYATFILVSDLHSAEVYAIILNIKNI